jgi:integrase
MKRKPERGTIADLVTRYRQSPRALGWAASTRRKQDKVLAEFSAANGAEPVASLRRGDLIAMRDSMAATPSEANNWLKIIRGLLDYGLDLEMIPHNPAARVKALKVPNPDGFRTWREDEIAAYEHHWPRGSVPRLAFTLALYTGAARGDLVKMGWHSLRGGRIFYRRQKTGAEVSLPILAPLEEELSQVPHTHLTFLQTREGNVRSPVALAGQLAERKEENGRWELCPVSFGPSRCRATASGGLERKSAGPAERRKAPEVGCRYGRLRARVHVQPTALSAV